MRVVSLLPSATEMLYTLGVEPVGVSHECDYPPAASDLPSVISPRVDPDASSAEINEQVAAAEKSGGVYEIDRELLADLDPDVVVSQGICDVCAVDDTAIREAVADLSLDARVITSDPHSLDEVFADLERLGDVLNREDRAQEAVADLRARVEAVAKAAPNERPRVAVFDWLDPVMVAGHWVPGMVNRAGGTYGLAAPGDRSTPREWAEIREYDPEVILAAPCGFGLDQTLENADDLSGREGWNALAAVREGQVYAVDGHHYVNRPGPRLVDTLELFAGVLRGAAGAPENAVVEWPSLPESAEDGRERTTESRS
ncbi:cobalamin-binding protein [Halobacteriales archaeon QH_10_65_19]|nr:MAG: cobalamin-binding protein [Halobacteriales archaeon QH_10_65_19]